MRRLVGSPWLNFSAGLLAVLFAGSEILRTLQEDLAEMHFGGHHAAAVLGLVHMLKALPEIVEGLERLLSPSES